MSACRSLGSNYHPSSQSRKISIGVVVDSLAKKRSGVAKEDEVTVPKSQAVNCLKQNSIEVRNEVQEAMAPTNAKQTDAVEKENSLLTITKDLSQKTRASDTCFYAKQTSSLPGNSGRQKKHNVLTDALPTYSALLLADQKSVLQSDDSKQTGNISYQSKGAMDGINECMEEFTFATAVQKSLVSEKAVTEYKTEKAENVCNEDLRTKLWEILGNASSPDKQCSKSQTLDMDANILMANQKFDQNRVTVVKRKQNSDTIETDSESPDHTTRRPLTRSLTRKKASTYLKQVKNKNRASSSNNQKHQENNIFSFDEGWSGRSTSTRKKIERRSSRIELQKILSPKNDDAEKIQQENDRSEAAFCAKKSSSLGSMKRLHVFPPNKIENPEEKNKSQEKDLNHTPMIVKTYQRMNSYSSALNENKNDFQSPTFVMKTPISSSSHSSMQKEYQMEYGVFSTTPAERTLGDNGCFRTFRTSKPDCYGSNAQKDCASSPRKQIPVVEEQRAENGWSESFSGEGESKNSEDGSPIIDEYDCRGEREAFSPQNCFAENLNFRLRPTKRLCSHEGIRSNEFSPISHSPKGTGESDWTQEPSEKIQEEGVARAVTLFALSLKKLKSKIKSATCKKSSEILTSAAKDIHLQLQNAESQIQTDLENMTSLGKSKRKHLDTRFQDQQEQLKLIHEKYKDEVNRHLQDCRSTLEGLEVNQIQLKGVMEKQKTSHGKLLLKVEEEVETQLEDAQRRITAVHKLARGKMLQLKCVIAECLKEGISV